MYGSRWTLIGSTELNVGILPGLTVKGDTAEINYDPLWADLSLFSFLETPTCSC